MEAEDHIKELFGSLSAVRKAWLLAALQTDLAEEFARAASMMAELQAMGFGTNTRASEPASQDRRQNPTPKFQSRKNPSLVWSGRGSTAKWLLAEMEETGLDIDAFRV